MDNIHIPSLTLAVPFQARSYLGDDPNTMVVLRFLGTTPNSSSALNTLASIISQIVTGFSLDTQELSFNMDLPQELNEMNVVFEKLLHLIGEKSDKQVVIFLDSLDQLSSVDYTFKLHWLPKKIPSNVYKL